MARRFLDNIRADVTTLLADNTTGLISAASMRLLFTDTIDSVISDEAGLGFASPVAAVPLTPNYALITGYTSVAGDLGLGQWAGQQRYERGRAT